MIEAGLSHLNQRLYTVSIPSTPTGAFTHLFDTLTRRLELLSRKQDVREWVIFNPIDTRVFKGINRKTSVIRQGES